MLDCLTEHGINIPSSCHSGLCQTCLSRAASGSIPARAQTGLKETQIAQNYFLACVCYPEHDIEVAMEDGVNKLPALVSGVKHLSADILGVHLKPQHPFNYRAGQFINFFKDENTVRSYSLASVPELDDELFLHVRKVPGGQVSPWMFEHLKPGDQVQITEPAGECFYVPGKPAQNILLVGTGSGLAPLYGIIRDALQQGHTGKIVLYHGSTSFGGLYLVDELRTLAQKHENFSYVPCISESAVPEGYASGMVLDVVLARQADLSGWRVFLCGHPEMVKSGRQEAFLAGASMSEIFADPF